MIEDENRSKIKELIRQYQKETGTHAIIRGKITEQFYNWRKNQKILKK